jgi:ABC-2 type transport system permease protein
MSFKIFAAHVAALLRDILRTPSFVVPAVIFPAMFYSIFALPYARQNSDVANMVMTSYVAFAIVGVAMFQFGVGVANERGRPWERYIRSLPVRVELRFAARVLVAMIVAAMAAGLVAILGRTLSPVTLTAVQWLSLGGYAALGAVPFVMLGLAIAYIAPPRGALPITNIVYLLSAFAGGLWMPPQMLPSFAAAISPYLPTRQYGELIWSITSPGHDPMHAALMLGYFTLAFSIVAIIGYRRDERARYA